MKPFPFPDKENSMEELRQDYVFSKIEPDRVEEIFEDAWAIGEEEACRFLERYDFVSQDEKLDMRKVFRESGIVLQEEDIDYVLGKRRYFAEYLSGKNLMKIYTQSVALWCEANGFGYEEGLNVILCHEYFHYLEWNVIGMVSRRYQVPILKIGSLKIGRTGVPSLSGIGANAFANICYGYLA